MLKKLGLKLKEQKGFTLIELLAVIVILGILAAIAIPSITNVINNTKDKAKVAEALQIIDAARLAYADDSSITQWKHTAATGYGGLSDYVSKVSDNGYIVTFDPSTKIYTIEAHEVAQVMDPANDDADKISEIDLANKAK